jgi:hypothetical protein
MVSKDIIVIWTSAGGFEALKKLVASLPRDVQASINEKLNREKLRRQHVCAE